MFAKPDNYDQLSQASFLNQIVQINHFEVELG
jgi:hypothetical protein